MSDSDSTQGSASIATVRSIDISHVVLLLHGIRDHAAWQKMVTEQLVSHHVAVIGLKYGYFYTHSFLWPKDISQQYVELVERFYRDTIRQYPEADVSIIAHSYGTYLLAKLMQKNPDVRFKRVILCGSVLLQSFDWGEIADQIGESSTPNKRLSIINDCGNADIWPLIARGAGWHYGDAGTHGFGSPFVTDRFHEGNHSLFFDPQFVAKYWKPFLQDGRIVPGEADQGAKLGWVRFMEFLPLKALLLCGVVILLSLVAVSGVYLIQTDYSKYGLTNNIATSSASESPLDNKRRLGVLATTTADGIFVDYVEQGFPATRCIDSNGQTFTLERGDIINEANGESISNVLQFQKVINNSGKTIRLKGISVRTKTPFNLTTTFPD